ncbi:MAG: glycosyltransferase family 4 protein [Leptolyngbyaceae cyanobacterium bins.59]|nr:glycosyltransferase family 4 protein [Leptolyngbyaceae cyanobacterium bins.59]
MKSDRSYLTLLSSYMIGTLPDGRVLMANKFFEEVCKFTDLWGGQKLRLLAEVDPKKEEVLETIAIHPKELPFELEIVSYPNLTPAKLAEQTAVVMTPVGHRNNHIIDLCRQGNVPCVYVTEYNLNARKQIVAMDTRNPLLRLRRNLWAENQERKRTRSIALSEGVQCNGTPTYDAYRAINRNPLLYFDNHVTIDLLPTAEEMETRTRSLVQDNQPLRLLFSGRLITMKGADHLLDVAQAIKKLGVPFHLYICGNGDLKESMERRIQTTDLREWVTMMGMLSFHTELVPFVRQNIDLFICCHRQSDPSCTYLETMSCGVPIVGYDNEAFTGVVQHSGVGWLVPMNQPEQVAQQVAALNQNRAAIREMSYQALNFAQNYVFERTYTSRVAHLKEVAATYLSNAGQVLQAS